MLNPNPKLKITLLLRKMLKTRNNFLKNPPSPPLLRASKSPLRVSSLKRLLRVSADVFWKPFERSRPLRGSIRAVTKDLTEKSRLRDS